MKIRTDSGIVEFEQGSIGPDVDKPRFRASSVGSGSDTLVSNDPYQTFGFLPEPGIAASASFKGDRLTSLSLLIQMSTDQQKVWTEELERRRKGLHDDWLLSELGAPPYRFHWGEVVSLYDPKGCVSDIMIIYGA